MIIVRVEIQCKWGRVDEVLARSKTGYEEMQDKLPAIKGMRILTDMSGSQDTVVLEAEVESMDAYFAMMDVIFASPEWQAGQAERTGEDHPYESAVRTFYKVEAVYE